MVAPYRPRSYGNVSTTPGQEQGGWLETEEEYQAGKDEALAGGYPTPGNIQLEAEEQWGQGGSEGGTLGGGYAQKRKGEQSRGQMNLTGGQGRSLLTGVV